jgi:hypothetical protein
MQDEDLYDGFGDEVGMTSAPSSLAPVRAGLGVGGGAGGPAVRGSLGVRPGTGARGDGTLGPGAAPQVRPMTSVAGAGYRASVPGTGAGSRAAAPGSAGTRSLPAIFPFKPESESGPEAQAAELEMRVHALLESSATAAAKGDPLLALERAKEAMRRERALGKFRESNGQAAAISADLHFSVNFTLANMVGVGTPAALAQGGRRAGHSLTPPNPPPPTHTPPPAVPPQQDARRGPGSLHCHC